MVSFWCYAASICHREAFLKRSGLHTACRSHLKTRFSLPSLLSFSIVLFCAGFCSAALAASYVVKAPKRLSREALVRSLGEKEATQVSFRKLRGGSGDLYVIDVIGGARAESLLATLRSDGSVSSAIENARVSLLPFERSAAGSPFESAREGDSVVEIAANWGIAKTEVPAAWEISMGIEDVVIAFLDTGMDMDHPDLVENLWTNPGEIPGNGRDDDGNGYVDDVHGYNFCENSGTPEDVYGHGSHTAGIAAAVHNGEGVVGVAPGARIMPLRFIECDNGTIATAIEAIHYAVDNGARVINNSWGIPPRIMVDIWGGAAPLALREAIEYANEMGTVFVASAGNFRDNNDQVPMYPAGLDNDNLIAVTSTDSGDQFHQEVNFGDTTVHVAAPGVDVFSTYMNGEYETLSGTSMAGPFVSGLAALILSAEPNLSPLEVRQRIMNTVDRSPNLESRTLSGGRMNARRALANDRNPEEPQSGGCEPLWVEPGCNVAAVVGDVTTLEGFVRGCYSTGQTQWSILEQPRSAVAAVLHVIDGTSATFTPSSAGTYTLQFCANGRNPEPSCGEITVEAVAEGTPVPEVTCKKPSGGLCAVGSEAPAMLLWLVAVLPLVAVLRRRNA